MMVIRHLLAQRVRSRPMLALCTVLVIALGLLSRAFPEWSPAVLGKYPGDALWALMVWLGWAMLLPRADAATLGWMALLTASAVELSQLYKTPWLDALRGTTLGHLALGSGFAGHDILAYAVGIVIGVWLDHLFAKIDVVFGLHHSGGSHV